ncbi:enoyl-CoA hydratase/carnithine racemase [Halomonas fontilapidosi]|uniref:Enoyl-CoA hydratase domain-containing protein 3, mitochondrial n=1 Tax=Halomonas fontilapidosi TaxID=616675 RepID=A0A7W5DKY1_9GAMM|nr:enoyl-CoA hydratase [Halomonas fontilapidosi]MBB3184485.1 enoyl-CoA hydratase/carnithine racemase [Halomonas fontilapidosi]
MHDDNPLVRRHEADGVTTLTLNRPTHFNALSEEMLEALGVELDRLADDAQVRCVVIAAEGRAFCAGHDLKQMRANPEETYYQQLFTRCGAVMQAIVELPVPVIARVQGLATAAGCQLVASCDLAVAARSSRFAVSGINAGLFCSTPAVALSRNVGRKRAMEMLFTGEFIDADQARDWGLVNRVADDEALDEVLGKLTASICAKSAVAVRTGKAMFHRQLAMPLDEAYAYAGEVMACNMMAEDAGEGIDAFIEKRPPQWRHR